MKNNETCPVCGNVTHSSFGENYLKCKQCESVYLKFDVSDKSDYFNEVYDAIETMPLDKKRMKILFLFEKLSWICSKIKASKNIFEIGTRLATGNGKILEIGFGEGKMLCSLFKKGFDVYGIDISESAVQKFLKVYGNQFKDRIKVYDISNGNPFKEKFKVVLANAVFEHIVTPHSFLQGVCTALEDYGFLILEIPAGDGNTVKRFGEKSISCWAPEHKILYSKKGLQIVLSRNNLSIVDYIYENPFGWFLLSELQSHGENSVSYWRNPAIKSKKVSLSRYIFLCTKSFILSLFLSKHHGDEIIVIAQKKGDS